MLDLTSDRYFDYYLRGAEVRSPAKNAEDKFEGRQGKDARLPVDFDSVYARDMDLFDYAVTTDADYQSGAPPNWEEVDRTDSYVLWKRRGPTPFVGVLAEEARPGRVLRCNRAKFERILERRGPAITWPRPVIAKRLNWVVEGEPLDVEPGAEESAAAEIAPGESATQTITLPPGSWDLSFQYASEVVPLEVRVGEESFEMPPGIEGAIPFRPDEGPYWPVGSVESDGGPVEITIDGRRALGAAAGPGSRRPRRARQRRGHPPLGHRGERDPGSLLPLHGPLLPGRPRGPAGLEGVRDQAGRPDADALGLGRTRGARGPRAATGRPRAPSPGPAPPPPPRPPPGAAPGPRPLRAAGRARSRPRTRG